MHYSCRRQAAAVTFRLLGRGLLTNGISEPPCAHGVQGQQGTNQEDFFRNLGAYLTMERAERVYKFSAAEYNLTDAQVGS